MTHAHSFRVGDAGVRIGLHFVECVAKRTVDLDLTGATLAFLFKASDGELTVIREDIVGADFAGARGDMVDGRVMWISTSGFFTVEGWMELQGVADFGTSKHYTEIVRFHVGRSLIGDADLLTHENGDELQLEDGT